MRRILLFSSLCIAVSIPIAQPFAMDKKCREQNASGIHSLKTKKYLDALETFTVMERISNTGQEKEASAVGKAQAYNGMGQYEEAIMASDLALNVSRNKSMGGYFQKGFALRMLRQYELANVSFSHALALTVKNKNKLVRASNYALLSSFQFRQMENPDSAISLLETAMSLDTDNPYFIMQKGELLAFEKNYDAAFIHFDRAVALGKMDVEIYTVRSNTRLIMMQGKYGATHPDVLRNRMSDRERMTLCDEYKKLVSLGATNLNTTMITSLGCK